jgi:predicted CoA-substrate-specific enzyme activase
MAVFFGCDLGTVSAKAAIITDDPLLAGRLAEHPLFETPLSSPHLPSTRIFLSPYRRLQGDPLQVASDLLAELLRIVPLQQVTGIGVTGAHGVTAAARWQGSYDNEVKAAACGIGLLYPQVRHIFDIGGEHSKLISIVVDERSGECGIADYATNGDCAAGTGSFLDQQASRLRYAVEEVGVVASGAETAAKIAGRCSVFAKSDMIHAQQRGAKPPEILKGLCEAVARNFRGNVVRGRSIEGLTALIGGVAANAGVVQALRELFEPQAQLLVPSHPPFWGAIGAALLQRLRQERAQPLRIDRAPAPVATEQFPHWPRLSLAKVRMLREEAEAYRLPQGSATIDAFLGLDIGSVSTNLVCIDAQGEIIHDVYLRTEARPVEVVARGLAEIDKLFGKRLHIRGVGTTGSGRELIGELIGADTINDEITAHKTGAFQVASRYLGSKVDTIFEIGGQDAKYISLRDGVVVDFAMNEACAAGTGSFLEEQAEKLGLNIIGEFAQTALAAERPIRLGERCTVYMEQDVTSYQGRGAERGNLVAGLAYSVVQNYLNRVVGTRPIGDIIFFQGGTAYNDAVAAAFAGVLGKPVIVPPFNGVIGAYGAALLARARFAALGTPTAFRGFRIDRIDYQVRQFTCQACSNLCDIHEFTIAGSKSHWGDKCSDRYRKQTKVPHEPAIPDLLKVREEALSRNYFLHFLNDQQHEQKWRRLAEQAATWGNKAVAGCTVGIPMALYTFDRLPFWGTYLRALGFKVSLSPPTSKRMADAGVQETVADPCFPLQVAHGHIAALLQKKVDYLFVPSIIDGETTGQGRTQSYMCPWGQTLPFVLAASPNFAAEKRRFLSPIVHFREGLDFVEKELWKTFCKLIPSRRHHRAALALAAEAQESFRQTLRRAGDGALARLEEGREPGIVLVGRSYNIYDRGINLNIPEKLRTLYGVNVLPLDFLPLEGIQIEDLNDNMYWSNGRKILQAARFTASRPHLHVIYMTNFMCGPDSYIKQFAQEASHKPFLTLQFDGHGNDAGMLTRCEAYLDSKGVLRWWQEAPSTGEYFMCPACATAAVAPSPPHFAP